MMSRSLTAKTHCRASGLETLREPKDEKDFQGKARARSDK